VNKILMVVASMVAASLLAFEFSSSLVEWSFYMFILFLVATCYIVGEQNDT